MDAFPTMRLLQKTQIGGVSESRGAPVRIRLAEIPDANRIFLECLSD